MSYYLKNIYKYEKHKTNWTNPGNSLRKLEIQRPGLTTFTIMSFATGNFEISWARYILNTMTSARDQSACF